MSIKNNHPPLKILMVGADTDTRDNTVHVLEQAGYLTCTADNSLKALQCLHDYKPQIVLLDLNVPDMDNVDLYREIKTTPKLVDVLVIICSDMDNNEHIIDMESEVDGYIRHPINNHELVAQMTAFARIWQLNHKLRESEARYERAVNGFNDGLWEWDYYGAKGDYISPRWKQLLGYADHEIPNEKESFFSRLHPEDITPLKEKTSSPFRDKYTLCNGNTFAL
ncbi:hypothetical protein TI05_14920 [Achromatium sp. WMS3]|nr:hypothetical protein TI05_14920 [Achromatium sp. WMS3]